MRLFYNATTTNFGDHINSWLWPRLIPDLLNRDDDDLLVGIGSLLKADLDRLPGTRKFIFGTGSGYGNPPPPEASAQWKVHVVRGPLTARIYGLDSKSAVTDGAWLISQLPEYAGPTEGSNDVVFVPHWTSAAYGNWKPVMEMAGLSYIDPLDDGPSILRRIAGARLAIVESLHGAIFADYFRTPWIAVSSPSRVLHFKWLDWCMSVDLEYRSLPLPPSDYVDFLLQGMKPTRQMPSLDAKLFTADMFRYSEVSKKKSAGLGYRSLTKAKSIARVTRAHVLDRLRTQRDAFGLARWNQTHRESLAQYLSHLKMQSGMLSNDAVRQDRIDQLDEALVRFRKNV